MKNFFLIKDQLHLREQIRSYTNFTPAKKTSLQLHNLHPSFTIITLAT